MIVQLTAIQYLYDEPHCNIFKVHDVYNFIIRVGYPAKYEKKLFKPYRDT